MRSSIASRVKFIFEIIFFLSLIAATVGLLMLMIAEEQKYVTTGSIMCGSGLGTVLFSILLIVLCEMSEVLVEINNKLPYLSKADNTWVCSCGKRNKDTETCISCGRKREGQ